LSAKNKDGEILFVDTLSFDEPKTAKARQVLEALSGIKGFESIVNKKNNSVLILTSKKDENVYKSFSNFNNVAIEEVRNLNTVDALQYKYLILVDPKESIDILSSRLEKAKEVITEKPVAVKKTVKKEKETAVKA